MVVSEDKDLQNGLVGVAKSVAPEGSTILVVDRTISSYSQLLPIINCVVSRAARKVIGEIFDENCVAIDSDLVKVDFTVCNRDCSY